MNFILIFLGTVILLQEVQTTSVCFSVVTVNYEHRKPEFKIKRRG